MKIVNPNIRKVAVKRTKTNLTVRKVTGKVEKNVSKTKKETSADTGIVKSSNLHKVDYDKKTKVLIITFLNRRKYSYRDVPAVRYNGLMNAASKGEYFNKFIRYRYKYKEI